MDFRALLYDSSKLTIINTAKIAGADEENFDKLFRLTMADIPKISQRALRVLNVIAEQNPELLKPYYPEILKKLTETNNESILFGFLHFFIIAPIPEDEEIHGELMNIAFDFLDGVWEGEAVRVYSMDILHRLTKFYPEIKHELADIIRSRMQFGKPSFQARGTKILKSLSL